MSRIFIVGMLYRYDIETNKLSENDIPQRCHCKIPERPSLNSTFLSMTSLIEYIF